jgi:hypothetical protein
VTSDAATSAEIAGAGPSPAQDAQTAAQVTQAQLADAIAAALAAAADAAQAQPSAGAASPTGMIKPPPVGAPLTPPRRQDEQAPDPPAFGLADDADNVVSPDDDTAPLPVILPDRMPQDVAQPTRMRDPFEPMERSESPLPQRVPQGDPSPSAVIEPPVAAKMDQIKDLYLTAEAIGEDALTKHFQQVSDRQRQLIREYFDQVAARRAEEQPKA